MATLNDGLNYIGTAATSCTAEASQVYGLFQQNVETTVKVVACQVLIAQECNGLL